MAGYSCTVRAAHRTIGPRKHPGRDDEEPPFVQHGIRLPRGDMILPDPQRARRPVTKWHPKADGKEVLAGRPGERSPGNSLIASWRRCSDEEEPRKLTAVIVDPATNSS